MNRYWLVIVSVALVAGAAGVWLGVRPKAGAEKAGQSYVLAAVSRGSIESVVSSTGTLSAVSTVSILSQMSGRVEGVYADYNDRVEKGQLLVALNTEMLRLEEKEALAAVRKAQANHDLQLLGFQNKQKLAQKDLVSSYELQESGTTLEVRAAELISAQSALEVIQTRLNQYARITSPIDGIVLDRNVEVGQSVVEGSSSNAASLFTLAEDLSKMEIEAEVDELDIGAIRAGQEVRFTVEASPGVSFAGTVHEVRLVPQTTDNVVSYGVMIDADNRDGALLPGLTAEVEFIKEKKTDVLVVPSAAFRFQPPELSEQEIREMVFQAGLENLSAGERAAALEDNAEARAASQSGTTARPTGLTGVVMPMGPRFGGAGGPGGRGDGTSGSNGTAVSAENRKTLWYLDDEGRPAVTLVRTGASDGTNTELLGAEALEGRRVIVKIRVE